MAVRKKILGSFMGVIMILSLLPMSVLATGTSFVIDDVEYDGTADTSTELFSTITSITYTDGGEETTLTIESDELATLTVEEFNMILKKEPALFMAIRLKSAITAKDASNQQTLGGPGVFLVGGLPYGCYNRLLFSRGSIY